MPRARANIIAKFIAQIETGTSSLISTREPAEATSPARVRISGRPAATSAPKASTRMASVTGQESISDFSIASRLASLKSDHSSEAPVGFTSTPSAARSCSGPLRSSATRTISLGSAPAPASRIAVLPSWLSVAPGCGCDDVGDPRVVLEHRGRLGEHLLPAASVTGPSVLCTTTWIAELALPPKCSWASSRAATDSEPSACQPAPERLGSTCGAKAPRPTIEQQPHDGGEPGVVGDPDAEPAQRAGPVAEVGVWVGSGRGGGWPSTHGGVLVSGVGLVGSEVQGVRGGRAVPGWRCRRRRRAPGR